MAGRFDVNLIFLPGFLASLMLGTVLGMVREKYVSGDNDDIVAASQFLHYHDSSASNYCYRAVSAEWDFGNNITEATKKKLLEEALKYAAFHKNSWKNATSFAWKSFKDPLIYRWFKKISVLGIFALPEDKMKEMNLIVSDMEENYSTMKVCPFRPELGAAQIERTHRIRSACSLSLEPDLTSIFMRSRNYHELAYYWKAWRDVAGKPLRSKYFRMVSLYNEAAKLNGFNDASEMLREPYESDTFREELEDLWHQVRPLYVHLHAYVRRKLIGKYGSEFVQPSGPIPAHILGNMWAQDWEALVDFTRPHTGLPLINVTSAMIRKNITVLDMVKMAEEFFVSLGLKQMPKTFWEQSVFEKPKNRDIICHASAWDLCNGKDFRIKQCSQVNMDYFVVTHHEMGHIQYGLQYAHQPFVFREGANPGFHEAIGDVIGLSVSNPSHLKAVGLLDKYEEDMKTDLNFLYSIAMDKIPFLPFSYLVDLWRWGVASGEIRSSEANAKWWELRLKYQGVCPPVKRTEDDFDPPAKYHISANVPYVRYFVSYIIQFQIHKELCDAAGHKGPLYKCDIYKSEEAGMLLSQLMEAGSSEPWQELIKQLTGGKTNRLDARPLLEYFAPLLEWLKEQNQLEHLGWESNDPMQCPGKTFSDSSSGRRRSNAFHH